MKEKNEFFLNPRKMKVGDGTMKLTLAGFIMALLFSFPVSSLALGEYPPPPPANQPIEQQQVTRTISGHINDTKGEPLIGVNVVEAGTSNGTITDIDGNYTLKLTTSDPILNISYIGFETQTVNVGNRTVINITLEEETSFLDEVVVVGYGTMRQKDLTGAISTIRTEALKAESPRSVQDLLRANSSGVNIGLATTAKGDATLQLRGKNTLKAGSSPLIVLDGVIYEGSLADINPMDVASIDILKDASSAAVYGAKAASGVVVIMTQKGGRGGKPMVSFNTSVGMVQSANQPKLLDAEGFIQYRRAYEIGKNSDEYLQKYPEIFEDPRKLQNVNQRDWFNYDKETPIENFTEEDLLRTWASRLELKAPEIDNFILGRTTDWAKKVFQTGLQQDYQVAISNKTDDVSYYWSLGYSDREGIIVGDRFTTARTRLNLESNITSFLRIGLNSGFSTRNEGFLRADWGQMVRISPYGADEIGNPEVDEYLWKYPTSDVTPVNPFFDNLYRDRKNVYSTLNANLYAILSLPFDIEYQFNFIPYYEWREYYNHESSKNFSWAANGGKSERLTHKIYSWQVDNILRWKKRFNQIHNIEATLLVNAEQRQYWSQKMTSTQFSPNDILGYHRIQAGTVPLNESDDTYRTGDALMGRLFYSLKDRYMITTSVRRDGYSAFGQRNPRAVFPAVALGWTFTEEKFAESITSWFDYGKLRLSWGENGNRDIGQYEALSNMVSGPHPYIDQNGNVYITSQIYVDRMSNPNLKWERTASMNVGLDFSFLHNRISGALEGYIATTNDLLVDRALPEIIGYNSVAANLGKLENRGFEATVNATMISRPKFEWNASANFSLNRRKIVSLYGDMIDIKDENGNVIGQREADDIKNKWFIGQDPDRIWDYERIGVWQKEEAEEAKIYGLQPGDFKYKDQNGDGVMTDDDKIFQGYKTPRFNWTFRNEFIFYKDLSLSTMFYSHWGWYDTFNRAANVSNFPDRTSEYVQPYWTAENRINDYARIGSKNTGNNYKQKSFIRWENITLSYNVPKTLTQKIFVQDMRVSLSVRNVAVFSPHWNFWDPERRNPDTDNPNSMEPTPRTYNISLNFTL
ncbi:SusC/RagA family TonB-linked outer membrane protein [Proteiniphilum acetatigenes]|uniref:SusC/RagA family TonB-linked outer membrane protein n=1 Tax=Proteiniphilum acetatigenes TaxID=294710 RepID=UPI00035C281F|nr:SusC/RagA family TonB-linked outer membrane protein [Proteiniphilum acetatigenes]